MDCSHVIALSVRDLRYVRLRLLLLENARLVVEVPSFKCNPKCKFDEHYRARQSQGGYDILIYHKLVSATRASACPL